jgi:hypothetical protein
MRGLSDTISGLDFLCKSLISKDLFLLEDFSRKPDFKINDGLLVNDATLWSAVIDKELLIINQNGFTLFHIAHESAVEVGIQVIDL